MLPDGGQGFGAMLIGLRASLDAARDFDAEVLRRLAELRFLATTLCAAAAAPQADPALPHAVADDFLRATALVLLAWAWAQIDATDGADTPRWRLPARALRERILPELDLRTRLVRLQFATPVSGNAGATGGAPSGPAH